MSHTPGPWHWTPAAVDPDDYGGIATASGEYVLSTYEDIAISEDDARLIAAAPELLAAALTIATTTTTVGRDVRTSWPAGSMRRLRDAIEAATGAGVSA